MGTRLRAARAFRRHRGGYSGLAYMTIDGIEDASFSGPGLRYEKCDREWFLMSVYTKLLPLVRRTPGAIVICDNARIHHSQVFIDLVEKNYDGTPTGAKVLFLPPFSPELNPIGKVKLRADNSSYF